MEQANRFVEVARLTALEEGQAFWRDGTEPLRHLTFQTGLLLVFAVLLAWLIARIVRSSTWRFTKPKVRGLTVMTTFHTNDGSVALSLEDYIRAFANDPEKMLAEHPTQTKRMKWGADRDKREHSQYFVVTLVQCDPGSNRLLGTPVLSREVRVWRKSNPPKDGFLQLDADALREVRARNNSSLDDLDGTEVGGVYDLYMRRVRWYDVRHWLVHPNREIRIALWVTIISMVVPPILDALFSA